MTEEHVYPVTLESTGLKTGEMTSSTDGLPTLEVASPPQFGGPENTWSPEHLYVAALASCLMTTFRSIAAASDVEIVTYRDHADGHLVRDENRLYRVDEVTLRPEIVIRDASKLEKANRILDKAEKACLVSRSVNTVVKLEGSIEAAAG
ncbi:MAG: OsmC family protein [Acidimicrobiia bacterium]